MLYPKALCNILNDLLYFLFTKQRKISSLPPTFYMLHGHLVISHYFRRLYFHLLEDGEIYIYPEQFRWKTANFCFLLNKPVLPLPNVFTVSCTWSGKCRVLVKLLLGNCIYHFNSRRWFIISGPLKHKYLKKRQLSESTF